MDQLFIHIPKFKDTKQELLESGWITKRIYDDILSLKVNNYLRSRTIKYLTPHIAERYGNDHFGLKQKDRVSFDHLLSLICYTDHTEFSRSWSESFRFIRAGETLNEIKERNSRYYHCSKAMIEMVTCFGISGVIPSNLTNFQNKNGEENGPYFCGINQLLTFPSFITRFCGPCSTSASKEVAIRFASEQGLVIRVNNYISNLHFFDCSWISRYKVKQ